MDASSEESIILETKHSAPCLQGGARARAWDRQPIKFSVKGPQLVGIEDEIMLSGCSILDITFTSPSAVGEVVFKNYYTASISVLVKIDSCWDEKPASSWVTAIANRKLMSSPHYEQGSQDTISLSATQSLVEWYNLIGMRMILRQPSPIWNTFHVEEINFYEDLPRLSQDHNKTLGLVSQAHHQQLLNIVTKQTRESLHWSRDLKAASSPRISVKNDKGPCAYEIARLPQIT